MSFEVPESGPAALFAHTLEDVPEGYYLKQWRSHTAEALKICGLHEFFGTLCADINSTRSFEAEGVYKHIAVVAKEATAVWLGRTATTTTCVTKLLQLQKSSTKSIGGSELPFYQLHSRLVQLSQLPCQAYREAATWSQRQQTMREFLTGPRMQTGIAILDAVRERRAAPVDGFYRLKEDPRSYLHPVDGLFVHVWHDAGEGRRFISCAQKLWQTIFEHRIRGVACPISAIMQAKGTCITFTLVPPICDAAGLDSREAPNAAREVAGLLAQLVGTTFEATRNSTSVGQLTNAHLYGGTDGRCYLTLPTIFGACPEDITRTGEMRRTPLRLEYFNDMFPKGTLATYTVGELFTRLRQSCIARTCSALMSLNVPKTLELVMQGVVPNVMKANGLNTRFMFLLYAEALRASQKTPPHVAVTSAIECEMLCRGLKCLVRGELAGSFYENDAAYLSRVNRLIKTIASGSPNMWQQLIEVVKERFNCNAPLNIPFHPRLVKVFVWYVGSRLGVSFNPEKAVFDGLQMGSTPNSSFYLVPDVVRFNNAQRRAEAVDLIASARGLVDGLPADVPAHMAEKQCRRLRLVFLEHMIGVDSAQVLLDISNVLFERRQVIGPVHLLSLTSFTVELQAAIPMGTSVLQSTALQLARQSLEGLFFPSGLLRDAPRDSERRVVAVQPQCRGIVADLLICWRRVMQQAGADSGTCTGMLVAAASCLLSSNSLAGLLADGGCKGDEGLACALPLDALDLATNAPLATELFSLCSANSFHVGLTVLLTFSLFCRRDVHMPRDLLTWRRKAMVLLFDACLSSPRPEEAAKLQVLCDATLHLHVKSSDAGRQQDPEHCMGVLRTSLCALRCLPNASPDVCTSVADMLRQLNKYYSDTPIVDHQGFSVVYFDPKDGSTVQAMALINSAAFSAVLSVLIYELLAQKEYQKAVLAQTITTMYPMPRSLKLLEASKEVDLHVRSCNTIKAYWRRAATGQGFDVNSEQFREAMAKQRQTHVRMCNAYAAGLLMSFIGSIFRLRRLALLDAEDVTRLACMLNETEERDSLLLTHRVREADFAVDIVCGEEGQGRRAVAEEETLVFCSSIAHPLLLWLQAAAIEQSQMAERAAGDLLAHEERARWAMELQWVEDFAGLVLSEEAALCSVMFQSLISAHDAARGVSCCVDQEAAGRSDIEASALVDGIADLCEAHQAALGNSLLLEICRSLMLITETVAVQAMKECVAQAQAEWRDAYDDFSADMLRAVQGGVTVEEEAQRLAIHRELLSSLSLVFASDYLGLMLAALQSEEQRAFDRLELHAALLQVTGPETQGRDEIWNTQVIERAGLLARRCLCEKAMEQLQFVQHFWEKQGRIFVARQFEIERRFIISQECARILRQHFEDEVGARRDLHASYSIGHKRSVMRAEKSERLAFITSFAIRWRAVCEKEEVHGRGQIQKLLGEEMLRTGKRECLFTEGRARSAVAMNWATAFAPLLAAACEHFSAALASSSLSGLVVAVGQQEQAQRLIVLRAERVAAQQVAQWEEAHVRRVLEDRQLVLMSTSRRSLKLSWMEEIGRSRLVAEEQKVFVGLGQLYVIMRRVVSRTMHQTEPVLPSTKHLRHLQRVVGHLPPSPTKQQKAASSSPSSKGHGIAKKAHPQPKDAPTGSAVPPPLKAVEPFIGPFDASGSAEELSVSFPLSGVREERSQSFGVFGEESMASFEKRLVTFLERRPTFIAKVRDEKIKALEDYEQTVRYQLEEEHADTWLRLVGGGQLGPGGVEDHGHVDEWFRSADDPVEKLTGFQEVLLQEAEPQELTPTREVVPDVDLMSPTQLVNSPHYINWPELKRMRRSLQVKEHLAREVIVTHHWQWFRDVLVDWSDAKKLHRDFINHRCRTFVVLLPFASALCLPPPKSVTDPRVVTRHEALRHAVLDQRRLVQQCEERYYSLLTEEELAQSKLWTKFRSFICLRNEETQQVQQHAKHHNERQQAYGERYVRLLPASPPREQDEVDEDDHPPPDHRRASFRRCPNDSPRLRSFSVLCAVPDESDVELSELFAGLRRVLGILRTADEVPLVERKLRLKFIEVEFRCRSRIIELLPKQQQVRRSFVSPVKLSLPKSKSPASWSPSPAFSPPLALSPFPGEAVPSVSSLSPIATTEPPQGAVASSPVGGRHRRDLREPYDPAAIPKYCDKRTAQLQQIRLEQQRQRMYAAAGIAKMPGVYHSSPHRAVNRAMSPKKSPLPPINNSY